MSETPGTPCRRRLSSHSELSRSPRIPTEAIEGLLAAEAVREEVERLDEYWEGWEFRLRDRKHCDFTVPVTDLVKPVGSSH